MKTAISAIIKFGKVFILDEGGTKQVNTSIEFKTAKILDECVFLISNDDRLFYVKSYDEIIAILPNIYVRDVGYIDDDLYVIDTNGKLMHYGGLFSGAQKIRLINPNNKFKQIYHYIDAVVAIDIDGNLWGDIWTLETYFIKTRSSPPSPKDRNQLVQLTKGIYFVILAISLHHFIAVDFDGYVYISTPKNKSGFQRSNTKNIKFRFVACGSKYISLIDYDDNEWVFRKNIFTCKNKDVDEVAHSYFYKTLKFKDETIRLSYVRNTNEKIIGIGEIDAKRIFNQIP